MLSSYDTTTHLSSSTIPTECVQQQKGPTGSLIQRWRESASSFFSSRVSSCFRVRVAQCSTWYNRWHSRFYLWVMCVWEKEKQCILYKLKIWGNVSRDRGNQYHIRTLSQRHTHMWWSGCLWAVFCCNSFFLILPTPIVISEYYSPLALWLHLVIIRILNTKLTKCLTGVSLLPSYCRQTHEEGGTKADSRTVMGCKGNNLTLHKPDIGVTVLFTSVFRGENSLANSFIAASGEFHVS